MTTRPRRVTHALLHPLMRIAAEAAPVLWLTMALTRRRGKPNRSEMFPRFLPSSPCSRHAAGILFQFLDR